MKVLMGPPAPKNPNPNPILDPDPEASITTGEDGGIRSQDGAQRGEAKLYSSEEPLEKPSPSPRSTPSEPLTAILPSPYSIPPWSEPPDNPFFIEVLKDGAIIEQHDVSKKGAYMFGRVDLCDFVLEHPTISRFHAVLQFQKEGKSFLYDLGSTHGTFINKNQVKAKEYTEVHVGDVIRFGRSSRLYIFQGPTELMPPEGDMNKLRTSKLREEMLDREASLLRARVEASNADGISWGIDEDAVEEVIDNDADEITWQIYRGELTERQEKLRGKVIKRMEKVANMKKEIDAIRAKDIAQGGLTQGQQTQIARNEQRTSQIMEELESLEETLNESIQESLGARAGKVDGGRKKKNVEDDDDILSDDNDEFFDRTKKKTCSTGKPGDRQSVETADTLLDKKESMVKEIEEMKSLLLKEKEKLTKNVEKAEGGDELDAYMSDLSSQLVVDETMKVEKEISNLQIELEKITYLLKIADPMGEAARKREVREDQPPPKSITKPPQTKQKIISSRLQKPVEATQCSEEAKDDMEEKEKKAAVYTSTKPQWLGDTRGMEAEEEKRPMEVCLDGGDSDGFVDYKDREKVLGSMAEIEDAAPGLIIRKRKPTDEEADDVAEADTTAADAVSLLLRHKRGYMALDEDEEGSKPKRVFGPSRPNFLLHEVPGYESWVPPKGQTGDGRTSLNERLGY